MKKQVFIQSYDSFARQAGERFNVNPVVILAQGALESGWGTSTLSTRYHNFFGICAYGRPNEFWEGDGVTLGQHCLQFRVYGEPSQSFFDFARLIRSAYSTAAAMSFNPEAFAKEIAYSKYISEVNGDNREAYRNALVQIARQLS
ncbi:MAG: glucosaminidase domain-containing protein [Tannerellaceae bacterium]|nr:glucosaminidase domain-containing protein [Tannerellaceae bacterium]